MNGLHGHTVSELLNSRSIARGRGLHRRGAGLDYASMGGDAKAVQQRSKVYIAGDDDQGVYEWAGADVQRFIDVPSYKVLDQSHRLPKAVHHFAMEISSRIAGSSKKIFNPRDEEGVLDSATNLGLNVSF
mgnify:CR=1 FL=1